MRRQVDGQLICQTFKKKKKSLKLIGCYNDFKLSTEETLDGSVEAGGEATVMGTVCRASRLL